MCDLNRRVGMAVLYEVWIPAVVTAHVIAAALLCYGLQHVNGAVMDFTGRALSMFFCLRQSKASSGPPMSSQSLCIEEGSDVCESTSLSSDLRPLYEHWPKGRLQLVDADTHWLSKRGAGLDISPRYSATLDSEGAAAGLRSPAFIFGTAHSLAEIPKVVR